MASILIRLERYDVHAGDDCSPWEFAFPLDSTLYQLTNEILRIRYFPKISGGEATWVMENKTVAVAVFAQQWSAAKFLIEPNTLIKNMITLDDRLMFFFRYLHQENPNDVYQRLVKE